MQKESSKKTAGGRWLWFSYRIKEENDSVATDTLVALFMKVTEKVLKINVCGVWIIMLLMKQIFLCVCAWHVCLWVHMRACVSVGQRITLGFMSQGLFGLEPFVAGRPAGQRASCPSVSTSTSHLALLGYSMYVINWSSFSCAFWGSELRVAHLQSKCFTYWTTLPHPVKQTASKGAFQEDSLFSNSEGHVWLAVSSSESPIIEIGLDLMNHDWEGPMGKDQEVERKGGNCSILGLNF